MTEVVQPQESPLYKECGHLDTPPLLYPAFPSTFTVGSKTTRQPLVSSDQLKGHITLLRAFHALRQSIENFENDTTHRLPELAEKLTVDERWSWFVGLAVER
jgi:hypothetical protein